MFYKDISHPSFPWPSFFQLITFSCPILLQNKWQACQERGRNFPRLFVKWLAPSGFSPVRILSSTRNTIITLSVPLPVLTTQKLVLSWWGSLCPSEPAQHSHHLHCPREPLQCCSFPTLLPWETAGLQGAGSACMDLPSKPCPLVWRRKAVIYVIILISFDFLILTLLLLKNQHPISSYW